MIRRYLIGIGAAGIIAGVLYFQHNQLVEQRERAAVAEQVSKDRLATLTHLQEQHQRQTLAFTALAKTSTAIKNAISNRDATIRRLERENDQYRQWADTLLPAAAQRLRQRPALAGADDYQHYLSTAEPLHPAPQSADDQRRPDAGN